LDIKLTKFSEALQNIPWNLEVAKWFKSPVIALPSICSWWNKNRYSLINLCNWCRDCNATEISVLLCEVRQLSVHTFYTVHTPIQNKSIPVDRRIILF
jgi:hypothetical protein